MKCWKHPRRKAVACGVVSRKGYCRLCWPAHAELPSLNDRYPLYKDDFTLWLAS